MSSVFEFIGVSPLAAPAQLALSVHEPSPCEVGDHKIITARKITARSVGRGLRVPPDSFPDGMRSAMNSLLRRLSYTEVDQAWQMSTVPPPLLLEAPPGQSPTPATPDDSAEPAESACQGPSVEASADTYADRNFHVLDEEFKRRFAQFSTDLPDSLAEWKSFALVAYSLSPSRMVAAWRIDRIAGIIDSDIDDVDFESLDVEWAFTAELEVWRMVLDGTENLASAQRQGLLRCVSSDLTKEDSGEDALKVAQMINRLRTAVHLLGLDSDFE